MAPALMRLTKKTGFALVVGLVLPAAMVRGQESGAAPPDSTVKTDQSASAPLDTADSDRVANAREHYAAAEYEEALKLLDGVRPEAADTPTRVSVEEYRALCLLALGRDDDARQAIVQLITLDPSYDVAKLDISPSAKKRFLEVRAQLLPGLARDEYEAGKAAFDRKAFVEAMPRLRKAISLSEAAVNSGADAAQTRDIITLARGFLDLASATSSVTPEAAARKGDAGDAPAGGAGATARAAGTKGTSGPPAAPPRAPVIVDPVPVRQDVPAISPQLRQLAGNRQGTLELTVDETGRVTEAVMRTHIYPVYDQLLLQAARNWRYRPGTVDGRPTARTVMVQVRPQ